ncbi:MAG: V-type ATP synthase subunit F [Candidatus Thorarchaeota archaeon]
MPEQKIFVIGDEETVIMMGLLGIEGKVLNKPELFLKEFNVLKEDSSIGMLIIALDVLEDDIAQLIDHKLSREKPLLFFLPNIFKDRLEEKVIFLDEIFKSIGKIIK